MKESGIGTTAIIVIVVAVVVGTVIPVTLVAVLLGGGGSIVGTWEATVNSQSYSATFNGDGTFNDTASQSGTWSLGGDILTVNVTTPATSTSQFRVVIASNTMDAYAQAAGGGWATSPISFTKVGGTPSGGTTGATTT